MDGRLLPDVWIVMHFDAPMWGMACVGFTFGIVALLFVRKLGMKKGVGTIAIQDDSLDQARLIPKAERAVVWMLVVFYLVSDLLFSANHVKQIVHPGLFTIIYILIMFWFPWWLGWRVAGRWR